MISIEESLRMVDQHKIAEKGRNIPSGRRYASEEMTARELQNAIAGNRNRSGRRVNLPSAVNESVSGTVYLSLRSHNRYAIRARIGEAVAGRRNRQVAQLVEAPQTASHAKVKISVNGHWGRHYLSGKKNKVRLHPLN